MLIKYQVCIIIRSRVRFDVKTQHLVKRDLYNQEFKAQHTYVYQIRIMKIDQELQPFY